MFLNAYNNMNSNSYNLKTTKKLISKKFLNYYFFVLFSLNSYAYCSKICKAYIRSGTKVL